MEYTPKPELPVHEVPRAIQEGEAEALATSVMRCADLNKNQELSFTELTAMLEATPHEGFGRYWAARESFGLKFSNVFGASDHCSLRFLMLFCVFHC